MTVAFMVVLVVGLVLVIVFLKGENRKSPQKFSVSDQSVRRIDVATALALLLRHLMHGIG